MPRRSLGLRATTLAAVTLAATAALATVPAAADEPPANHTTQSQQAPHSSQALHDQQAPNHAQAPNGRQQPANEAWNGGNDDGGRYKGRVVAHGGLYLRDKPTRSSRIVGLAKYGSIVHIFCKTRGDNVDGNNRWYLLTDGTWAWGSARYIDNIGPAPRWC
ncbi:SH3 domain-containing protein [Streptomyces sp. NRRL F-5126]|uniref:SH3 domain-containing protein n=1 Tax=Streptomyces sp. NRRL F-5126 TaxID=1463857 RepID=UPI0004C7308A|nr:SH3 domain-containing protein [Streptomyces sp. NRRL F-5126]